MPKKRRQSLRRAFYFIFYQFYIFTGDGIHLLNKSHAMIIILGKATCQWMRKLLLFYGSERRLHDF